MSSRRILEKLLQSGQSMLDSQSQKSTASGRTNTGSTEGTDWKKVGQAALSGGALAGLIGSRRRRGIRGKVSKLSSMAALAGVAYRGYSEWQRQKQGQSTQAKPMDQLSEAETERHSQAVLRAIIGAAKADGHIDEQEREMIESQIAKDPDGENLRHWFDQELRKPLDPKDIARAAETPEMAAEMYTASLLIIDERNAREQDYLDQLARSMNIPPDLQASLEREVRQG